MIPAIPRWTFTASGGRMRRMPRRPIRRRGWPARSRAGSPARLSGPCPDGEPQRLGRRYVCDAGGRHRGAGGGRGHGDEPAPGATVGGDKGYDTRGFVAALRRPGSRRTSRSTPRAAAVPSTAGRRAILATPSVSRSASAWKKSSAGPRRSASFGKPGTAGCGASAGCLPLPPPCTTWCGSGTCLGGGHTMTAPAATGTPSPGPVEQAPSPRAIASERFGCHVFIGEPHNFCSEARSTTRPRPERGDPLGMPPYHSHHRWSVPHPVSRTPGGTRGVWCAEKGPDRDASPEPIPEPRGPTHPGAADTAESWRDAGCSPPWPTGRRSSSGGPGCSTRCFGGSWMARPT